MIALLFTHDVARITMFILHGVSRRTLNTGTVLTACLAVTLGVAWSAAAVAQTTVNWNGSASTDYNDGANWDGGSVPNGTTNIAQVGAASNNPSFSSGPSVRRLNVNYGGVFNMTGGNYLLSQGSGDTRLSLGANTATGTSTLNVTGGSLQVDGQFFTTDGRSGNNSVAVYNQSAGTLFANATVDNNPIQFSTGGSNVGYRTLFNITGGTTVSSAAISMGQSASNGNAAFATGTISGGVLMATRFFAAGSPGDIGQDDRGTLRFSGGGFQFSGGQMIGTDLSARDGFRQGTTHTAQIAPLIASGTVGIQYAGGMMQIYTDRNEGVIYYVQTDAPDPSVAYTQADINRGAKRGFVDVGPETGAAWTSLANTAIKVNMSTGVSPARLDTLVTKVATVAAFDVADFNTDGVVDQGDYVYWQSQNGLTYSGAAPIDWATVNANGLSYWGADGNGDSKVDAVDLAVWQARVGQRRTDGAFQFAKDQTMNVASGTVSQSDPGFTVGSDVSNMNLTVFSPMNTKTFTKTGAGEFVLSGSNSWTYSTTVSQGTLRVSGSQAFVNWSGTTTVQPGATLRVDPGANVIASRVSVNGTLDGTGATIKADPNSGIKELVIGAAGSVVGSPAVVVSNTGSVALSGSSPVQVTFSSLNVDQASGGKVDLGRGLINIASGSAADLVADILAGRGDGSWNGTSGITSSAAESSGGFRTVGWLDNGDGSLTVAYAAGGDTNLDWTVDILDGANFLSAGKFDTGNPATWNQGDFTYDGVVDILDAADFLATGLFDAGTYNAPVSSISAVPEPTSTGVVVGMAGLLLGWRLRRRTA
jgi:autotransporter-associated beta strand protein